MSPLGKYSDITATIVSILVIAAWLLAHTGVLMPTSTDALDTAATLIIGVVIGQRATTNGAGKIAQAAHTRLDAIHAPSTAAAETITGEA